MKSIIMTIIFVLPLTAAFGQTPTPNFAAERSNRQMQIKETQAKMKRNICYNNFFAKDCTKSARSEYNRLEKQVETLNGELDKINQAEGLAQKEAFDKTPKGVAINLGQQIAAVAFNIGCMLIPGGIIVLIIWLWLRRKTSTAYGSAESASFKEIKEKLIVKDLFETTGAELILGSVQGKFIALSEDISTCHVLALGPTGAGKSYSLYLPNIAASSNVSYFINDTKGEIWNKVSGYLPEVRRFAPTEPERSEKFNWIPYLRGDNGKATALAEALVTVNLYGGQKTYWETGAINLLAGLWLHVAETDDPTPGHADKILRGPLEDIIKTLKNSPSNAAETAIEVAYGNEKSARDVVSTLAGITQFMLDKKIRSFTNTPRMTDWRNLRETPTVVFWSVPDTRKEVLKPLTALALALAFEQLSGDEYLNDDQYTEPEKVKALMMLDELASIGKIPGFTDKLALVRSKGIGIIAALQSYGQLEEIYGHAASKTIKDNFQTKVIFKGLSYQTTEEISRDLGEYTHQERVDDRTQMHARRLMTAEEISNLPKNNILIKVTGVNPFLASKIIYDLPDRMRGIKPMKNVTLAEKQTSEPKRISEPPKELPNRMPPRPPKFDL